MTGQLETLAARLRQFAVILRISRKLFGTVIAITIPVDSVGAAPITKNEALVLRVIFDDCLGYVRDGRTPFIGLRTKPASAEVVEGLPSKMPDRERAVEFLSPRYVAAWGADDRSRHCTVQTIYAAQKRGEPALLGVSGSGFTARMTKRAVAEGLTEGAHEAELSPLAVPYWSEPADNASSGFLGPISVSITPTDGAEGDDIVDLGLIAMSGPPLSRD